MGTAILIVTVTKVESEAILTSFQKVTKQKPKPIPIGNRIYRFLGTIDSAPVYTVQSEMGAAGIGAALQTVEDGIAAVSPDSVVMVGIAFGIDSNKQSIGDILVSSQLLPYELQRFGTNKKGKPRIILRGDRPRASDRLLNLCRSADLVRKRRHGEVWIGLVLSGDKLVDNIDFRSQLGDLAPEAIGGEMEGAGLYAACQSKKVDWILIKAICDWADGHKDRGRTGRQKLAARNAANFALDVLRHANQQFGIAIDSNNLEQPVRCPFDVEGTGGPLPDGHEMWLFAIAGSGNNVRYWPQERASFNGTTWKCPVYSLGGQPGQRKRFGAFVIGENGRALVRYFREAGNENSKDKVKRYPGISQLTSDVTLCDTAEVTLG